MELSMISAIIIVLLVSVFSQVKGGTNVMSEDEYFSSGSSDIDIRGKYELVAVYKSNIQFLLHLQIF